MFSQDTCISDGKHLQNTVLNIMISVACLGIIIVALTWILMLYKFYKLKGEFKMHQQYIWNMYSIHSFKERDAVKKVPTNCEYTLHTVVDLLIISSINKSRSGSHLKDIKSKGIISRVSGFSAIGITV